MRVEYSSNNSGGSWWLEDKHWKALEKAGWEVEWGGLWFCRSMSSKVPPQGHVECQDREKFIGHRHFTSYKEAKAAEKADAKVRWLGALATRASKAFPSLSEAVVEWERVTGMNASDDGCSCCGAPHSFHTKEPWAYASGSELSHLTRIA